MRWFHLFEKAFVEFLSCEGGLVNRPASRSGLHPKLPVENLLNRKKIEK